MHDVESDVWTFGTILRNPGCDFEVMFLCEERMKGFDCFAAIVIHDGMGTERTGNVITCGGRHDSDPASRWKIVG